MVDASTPDLQRALIVSDARSIHTARWANGLASRGLMVAVASLQEPGEQHYDDAVELTVLPGNGASGNLGEYVRSVPALRRLISSFGPDLVNSHYASNYALLGDLAVARRLPHLVSVWGSDVYKVALAGLLPRQLVTNNLRLATAIGSTSEAMARQTRTFAPNKKIFLTPFGIDPELFTPADQPNQPGHLTLGTVKGLSMVYGIDILIDAFARARAEVPELRLVIYGQGPAETELQQQISRLNLDGVATLAGPIPHDQVPNALRSFDIFAALSRSESFGVAILEANACGVPVVASDADGPAEVTIDGVTGLIVPREDPTAAAKAIVRLARDPRFRADLGRNGRDHVLDHYTWQRSLDAMLDAYRGTIAIHQRSSRKR